MNFPLYLVSMALGFLALLFYIGYRFKTFQKWPSPTDCAIVWGAFFAVVQIPITVITIAMQVNDRMTLDIAAFLGYGTIMGLALPIQELFKKFRRK